MRCTIGNGCSLVLGPEANESSVGPFEQASSAENKGVGSATTRESGASDPSAACANVMMTIIGKL